MTDQKKDDPAELESGVVAEQAPREETFQPKHKSGFCRVKTWHILAGVAVLILVIVLPLTLVKSSNRNQREAANASVDNGETSEPPAAPTTSPPVVNNVPSASSDNNGNLNKSATSEVPPLNVNTNETTTIVDETGGDATENATETEESDNNANTDTYDDGNNTTESGSNTTTTDRTEDSNTTASSSGTTATISGVYPSTLSLFGQDILSGYSSTDELFSDLEQALWFKLSQLVTRNLDNGGPFGNIPPAFRGDDIMVDSMPDAFANDAAESSSSVSAGVPVGSDVNDFGTNNQEENVEEGDVIVSDGSYVYAAYGDYVAIWNPVTGEMVTKVRMPEIEIPQPDENSPVGDFVMDEPAWIGGGRGFLPRNPRPNIRSLVLDDESKRLLVIVNGYGDMMARQYGITTQPVLGGFLDTQLRLYDTSTLPDSLTLLASRNVHGNFNEVRMMPGGYAHVMTVSSLQTYPYLEYPLERWNLDAAFALSNEEYTARVEQEARETSIPNVLNRLLSELDQGGATLDLSRLVKLSLWQTSASPAGANLEAVTFSDGVMNSMAHVHSMDMRSDAFLASAEDADPQIDVSSSATFLPGYWAQFYGSTDTLIVAGQGWNYDASLWRSSTSTYLIGFQVNGTTSVPQSVGRVDGYLLNNHAIDVTSDGVLRVATSINNAWAIRPSVPVTDIDDIDLVTTFVTEPDNSRTENYVITLNLTSAQQVQSTAVDGLPEETKPTGVMEELGRVKLGLPNELFTAVRFFDNVAYAVTFERKDPFYVLNLTDPSSPNVTAALNITGFSSYLHSMNDDNSMILAIGQEADLSGFALGVQLTVFDVTDPTNPQVVKRHVIEQDTNTYSYTDMENDFKSGRYVKQIQRLIIPMDIYGNYASQIEGYHGFITFVVNSTDIQEDCRVPHGEEEVVSDGFASDVIGGGAVEICYYCAYFPPRNMIFNGNLMTVKDHFIKSTDMNTCTPEWSLDVTVDDTDGDCCGMWPFM